MIMKALNFMVRVRSPAKYHRAKSILKVVAFIALSMFIIVDMAVTVSLLRDLHSLEKYAETSYTLHASTWEQPYYNSDDSVLKIDFRRENGKGNGQGRNWKSY